MVDDAVDVMTTESSFANLIHTMRSPSWTVFVGTRGEVVDLGAVVKSVSAASSEYKEKAAKLDKDDQLCYLLVERAEKSLPSVPAATKTPFLLLTSNRLDSLGRPSSWTGPCRRA